MGLRNTLALAGLFVAHAPVTLAEPSSPGIQPGFSPGEEISFAVEYLHISTGEGRVTVGKPEGSIWPVVCQARTDGLASLLDIREFFVSYWDAEAKLPRGSDLHALELGDRHTDISRFDREQGKVTVRIQRKGKRSENAYDVPKDAHDAASVVFYLRSQPLAPGDHFEVPVFTGTETFTLVADVGDREAVTTPAGRFEAFKVRVRTAFTGKFSANRDTFIWLTDDVRHVPVRISADFAVGTVVVTLTSYKPGGEVAQR
jgi:hypothetical protein